MALKIAILASGSGTNAQSMIDKAARGVLDIDIRLIAGNRPGAKVFERAEKAGIPHVCIDHKAFADRESFDREMVAAIKASGAEYVVLAGYMRLLTSTFLQAFPGRVINIHPAILPSFPGAHGGPDAQAYGVKITGCTVHFVEELVDSGPVIIQAAVHGQGGAGRGGPKHPLPPRGAPHKPPAPAAKKQTHTAALISQSRHFIGA